MIAKVHRLTKIDLNKALKQQGHRVRTEHLSAKSVCNGSQGEPTRFAVVISKKLVSGAVERNRIRRVVYESVAKHLRKIEEKGEDIIIFLDKKPTAGGQSDLEQEIATLLVLRKTRK